MRVSIRLQTPWLGWAAALAAGLILRSAGALAQGVGAPKTAPASAPAGATRPAAMPPRPRGPLTDEQVDLAIQRGLKYLFQTQQADGTWTTRYSRAHEGGCEALAALTALSAGVQPEDPKLKLALAYLAKVDPKTVYVRAMRAMVYARLPRAPYPPLLEADAAWLLAQQSRTGGWGYGPGHRMRSDWTDASNTQMAVLALRDAADAGATVPAAAWKRIGDYWATAQNTDGGWGYEPPGKSFARLRGSSHGSMTAAGVACLLIVTQKNQPAAPGPAAPPAAPGAATPSYEGPILRGFDWLAKNYSVKKVPGWVWGAAEQWPLFYLWCLARACNHGGVRNLGTHDWYPELAAEVLSEQQADGSWVARDADAAGGDASAADAPVRTCFALLALIEGRSPVMINDLGGRPGVPDEVGRFVRWVGGTFKRAAAWQALQADAPANEFREAPVLYLHVRDAAELDALPAQKIRELILNGGSVAVNVAVSDPALVQAVQQHFLKLFADYEYQAVSLGADHPVWSVYYTIAGGGTLPRVIGIGDHCRTRIFILTDNMARSWRDFYVATSVPALYFGVNLLYYTTDMQRPGGRLSVRAAPRPAGSPIRAMAVARVRHAGGWTACPMALTRLSDVLTEAISLGVKEEPPVDLSQDVPKTVPLLWMTGSEDPKLNGAQMERLKKYIQDGGTLLADSTVGKPAFTDAMGIMLQQMFDTAGLREIPANHPLITGKFAGGAGADLRKVGYTRSAGKGNGDSVISGLMGVELNGRLAVIVSRYGVTCPLEGLPTSGCMGFQTEDARRLAANVALYAIMGP